MPGFEITSELATPAQEVWRHAASPAGVNLELADERIRVNAIAPDIVDTPHMREFEGSATGGTREARERGVPLRRPGSVEDCAGACIFLASDMASYITGVTLSVDGGTFASSGWTRNPDGSWGLFH